MAKENSVAIESTIDTYFPEIARACESLGVPCVVEEVKADDGAKTGTFFRPNVAKMTRKEMLAYLDAIKGPGETVDGILLALVDRRFRDDLSNKARSSMKGGTSKPLSRETAKKFNALAESGNADF